MVGISFFFTACSKSCDAQHVIAVFELPRELEQLLAEIAEREVLRRHQRRRGAAEARCLHQADVADTGERRKALAKRIQARKLRLHLAQLYRHGVQVLLHESAAALGLGFLRGEHQAVQGRQRHVGRIAQAQPIGGSGGAADHQEENQRARQQVARQQAD